jgi:type IV pilus assembly protein PilN
MATINLLPWRDEKRLEQRKDFFVMLGLFALTSVILVLVAKFILDTRIENQQARNAYLKSNIAELNLKIKEIEELKRQKAALVDRMSVIQSLQGDRPEIVHIFDEIVRALPDGVYFDQITRKGSFLSFRGSAESNNRVSSLMRQLNSSNWMSAPSLKNVTKNPSFGPQGNKFELTVSIVPANTSAENK